MRSGDHHIECSHSDPEAPLGMLKYPCTCEQIDADYKEQWEQMQLDLIMDEER